MKLDKIKFKESLKNLKTIKVLVVGDAILDEYHFGEVTRISPEAPVPVVLIKNEKQTLGGAGNVIKNLSAIGVKTEFFAKVGKDVHADKMKSLLLEENLKNSEIHFVSEKEIPTIVKTRIIASNQQICRIDKEKIIPLKNSDEKKIFSTFLKSLKSAQGIILSDYDKGFFSDFLIEEMILNSIKEKKIITVDPQVRHFFKYKKIDLMTPNHHEAGAALQKKLITDSEIEIALKEISKRLETKSMMITRGEKGMSLLFQNQIYHIPTEAKEVFDVTGAGDTVISIYTAFRSSGLNELEASLLSNVAAGIVVEKLGASTVTISELEENLIRRKLL